jgi:hypothetical protein
VAPSLALSLSHAEIQFVALTTDAETQILVHETNESRAKIKGAREREKILAHNREEVIRVFLSMPEEDRLGFSTRGKRAEFLKNFKEQAASQNVQWVKKAGKSTATPPSPNTIKEYIENYLKVAFATPH